MTRHSTYPRSVAKYIRRQKSRIRRQIQSQEEVDKRITELLASVKSSAKHHETS